MTPADRSASLSKLRVRADALKSSAIMLRVWAHECGDAALMAQADALEGALGRLRERAGVLVAGGARGAAAAADDGGQDGEAWGE